MRALDHKSQKVLADISAGRKPDKTYSEAMKAWYRKNSEDMPELSRVAEITFEMHESDKQSEVMEALILSKCPPEVIEESFSVPTEVTAWYAELFFDISVFRTDLDRLEYLEGYDIDWARDLKIRAVNLGYEFVLFTYANLIPKNDSQKRLVDRIFMATAYKAMSMNYNGIGSGTTKQAIEHAKLMLKAFDALNKIDTGDSSASHDLIQLLGKKVETGSALYADADTPKPEEII